MQKIAAVSLITVVSSKIVQVLKTTKLTPHYHKRDLIFQLEDFRTRTDTKVFNVGSSFSQPMIKSENKCVDTVSFFFR